MALTDKSVRSLKAKAKAVKYSDEKALYLEVSPSGGKLWRMKYRFVGKEKRLSFGAYPAVSLNDARERRDKARKLLAKGIDPGEQKKVEKRETIEKAGNTFKSVAEAFLARRTWADSHKARIQQMLERDVYGKIAGRPISDLHAKEILEVLRPIEERAPDTANRALGIIGQIFRYGVYTHVCTENPTTNLRGALVKPESGHFATVLDPKKLGAILRAFDGYEGTPAVTSALMLAPLVFVRPGELRYAEWSQVDWKKNEWAYHIKKTRRSGVRELIVPLSTQAVSILRKMQVVSGNGRLVFPGARGGGRPISDNSLLAAMRRLEIPGEELTTHGLRATARTLLDEELSFRPDIIEMQLGHVVKDPNGEAYNRTKHLPERHRMMQKWADYLDSLKAGGELIEMRRSA